MANLLSSFLNGSSTFTYNNGTNVIPSYTLVQPTFSNTSTGASIFNQTFGSSSSFGNSLLFGSSLGGSTLTGSFGNSFNVGGFNTSFNYGSLGNGFGFGTTTRTTTTTNTGPTVIVNATEDTVFNFGSDDFTLSSGDEAAQIRIISLPSSGVLTSGGLTISVGDYLEPAQLDTLIYTPDADAFGTDSFTVAMSDDGATFSYGNSTVTISVLGVPEAPVATPPVTAIIVSESTSVDIGEDLVATFSDVDGDVLTSVTINSTPNSGTLTHSAGTVVTSGDVLTAAQAATMMFTPSVPAGSTAVPDSFNYTLSDGTLTSSTVAFPLSIVDGNDAPSFTSGTANYNLDENSIIETTPAAVANANDVGDSLTYSLSGADASYFAVDPSTGEIHFAIAQDYEDPSVIARGYEFHVNLVATDSGGLTALQAVTITLDNVANENSPIFSGVPSSISMDEVPSASSTDADLRNTGIVLTATDADGEDVTYSLDASYGDNDLFEIVDDELLFRDGPDADTPDDSSTTVTLAGDNIYDVEVTASDTAANTDTQTIAVIVNPIEDNAVTLATLSTGTTVENTVSTGITAVATDDDAEGTPGSQVFYDLTSGYGDNHLFAIDQDGVLTFIDAPDFEEFADVAAIGSGPFDGIYEVQIEARDGTNTVSEPTTVVVTNADDDSPVFADAISRSVAEDTEVGDAVGAALTFGALNSSSEVVDENAILSYSITSGNTGDAFFINNAGLITVANEIDFESLDTYELLIEATDVYGNVGEGQVDITVTDVDDKPTATDYETVTAEDNSVSLGTLIAIANAASYDDAEGVSAAEVVLISGPSNGEVQISSGTSVITGGVLGSTDSWSYHPDADFNGTDTFEIAFRDVATSGQESDPITVSVAVEAVNDRPVIEYAGVSYSSELVPLGMASSLSLSAELLPLVGSSGAVYTGDVAGTSIVSIGTDGSSQALSDGSTPWEKIEKVLNLADGSNQPVVTLTGRDVDGDIPSSFTVQQYEVRDEYDRGWLVIGNNGWDAVSDDFSVDSNGILRFTDATSNGTFSSDDEVLLAIQTTDSSGLVSDYYMINVEFA